MSHKFANPTAPLTNTASHIARFLAGASSVSAGELLEPPVGAEVVLVVVVTTAEVNGTPPVVVVAPSKAGACVAADGSGVAVLLSGLSTLSPC
jgi:hypothetical protein